MMLGGIMAYTSLSIRACAWGVDTLFGALRVYWSCCPRSRELCEGGDSLTSGLGPSALGWRTAEDGGGRDEYNAGTLCGGGGAGRRR